MKYWYAVIFNYKQTASISEELIFDCKSGLNQREVGFTRKSIGHMLLLLNNLSPPSERSPKET